MTSAFLFFFGIGLLAVAYQAYRKGEIRAGSSGFKPYTPTREENPVAFYFFLSLYLVCGFTMLIWAILVLAGIAQPMPVE